MIEIPFLNNFLGSKVKKSTVADWVDHLNYYVTSYLLGLFAVALAGKQYFGSPIQCWAPSEFKSGWIDYAEDFCFIANSYHVPADQFHFPKHGPARGDHYSYYRWVPMMLAIQAICFYVPSYFWQLAHRQTAVNPEGFIEEAEKVSKMFGQQKRREMRTLAENIRHSLSDLNGWLGTRQASLLYLLTKALYLLNIYLQYLILTSFLGQNYVRWGYTMAYQLLHGIHEEDSVVFPRVIMCDFQIRTIANPHPYTIQCVLMMNYLNEKLYFLLYFWFIFLAVLNLLSCLFHLTAFFFPRLRAPKLRKAGDKAAFVREELRPDGVLLLGFISSDVGSLFSSQLADVIYEEWSSSSSSTKASRSSSPATSFSSLETKEVDDSQGDEQPNPV